MKNNLFFRFMLTTVFVLSALTLSAQDKKYGVALSESFENGLPDTWTQEYVVGNQGWIIEDGNSGFPMGAAFGDKRIALRNGTSQTIGYVTRLVTPVMNLDTILEPILTFAYATDKWAGDFDTLRIYYRTSTDKEWVEYTDYASGRYRSAWTLDTIRLNAPSATYQLAFEGSDNMGRGIVLDNIQVRSTPSCETPEFLPVINLKNNTVTLSWRANFDADRFRLKVDSLPLSAEMLNSEEAKAAIVDAVVEDRMYKLADLKAGRRYYAYIQSLCPSENSDWSEQFSFKTTNMIDIPYVQNFNLDYTPGYIFGADNVGWYANDYSDEYLTPFINTGTADNDLYKYSRKSTRALFFTDNNSVSGYLDPGDWCYVALPELKPEDDIRTLQVSFWGMSDNDKVPEGRLIVGVMTDPADKESFVAVETVKVEKKGVFYEFIVPFDKYTGDGRFIALMSDFEDNNYFILDDFRVDPIPPCSKAKNLKLSIKAATEFIISWTGTTEGEVIILPKEIDPQEITDETACVLRKQLNSNPGVVDGIAPWASGYLYVRNKCGEEYGAWSNPIFIRMPERIEMLPDTMSFDINTSEASSFYLPVLDDNGKNTNNRLPRGILALISNSTAYPMLWDRSTDAKQTTGPASKQSLMLNPPQVGSMVCAIMPYIEDVTKVRISMMVKYYYTYANTARFEVGVMSDTRDISTFVPVDTVWVGTAWHSVKVSFDKYDGDGHFIAFRATNEEGEIYCGHSSTFAKSNMSMIDDLVFEAIPDCREPDKVDISFDNEKVTFSWDAAGMTEWRVRMQKEVLTAEMLEDDSYDGYIYDRTVSGTPSVTFDIEPNGVQYYYSVSAVCGSERSDWMLPSTFTSVCLDAQPLPYKMDFDGYAQGANKYEFPVPCWTTKVVGIAEGGSSPNTNYFPSLSGTFKYGDTGKSLHLKHGTSNSTRVRDYVVLPIVDEADMTKLQIRMMMMCSPMNNSTPRLDIGVVSDPSDTSTFSLITSISTNNKSWCEYIAPLTNFTPGKGQYLTLKMATDAGNFDFYIDDVVIDYIPRCAKVQNLKCESSTIGEAVFSWNAGGSETNWDVIVTTAEVDAEVLDAAMATDDALPENVARKYNTSTNPFTATGLTYNSRYWFYVRANCGGEDGVGEWNGSASPFTTECAIVTPGDLTFNDFKSDLATNCWTELGNKKTNGDAVTSNLPARTKHTNGVPAYEGEDDYLLKFYCTKDQQAYAIAPLLDVDHVKNVEVSFMGSGSVTYGEKVWGYDCRIRVGVITQTELGNFDYTSFEEIAVLDGFVDYQPYTVSFDEYEMDYNDNVGKHIMFMMPEGGDVPKVFCIDNIRFDNIAENPAPVDLKAEEITATTAQISWRNRKVGQTFEVKYAIRQLSQDELNGTVAVTDVAIGIATSGIDTAVIGNLIPARRHYAYVRAIDAEGNKSVWSAPIRFTSDCPVTYTLPYSQNFDPAAEAFEATIPVGTYYTARCWTSFYSGQTTGKASVQYPYIYEKKGVDETNALYVYASSVKASGYGIMPALEGDLANMTLSFDAMSNTAYQQRAIVVGVSRDISTNELLVSTFEPVDTIIIEEKDEFEQFFIPFAKYGISGTGNIVFTTDYNNNLNSSGKVSSGGYYLDNVNVYITPSCPQPEYLTVAEYGEDFIKLSFEEMGGADKWQVKCIRPDADFTAAPILEFDSVTPVISGLSPMTTYKVYVRAYCSDNEQSDWIGPIVKTTMALPVNTYPYTMNFEDSEAAEFENWMLVQDLSTDKWYRGMAYNYPEGEASGQLYISSDGGTTAVYDKEGDSKSYSWAYRRMKLDAGQYKFNFDWACDGYSSSNFLHAGLFPTDVKFDSKSDRVIQGNGIVDNLDYYSYVKSPSSQTLDQYISLDNTIDGYWRLYNSDSAWVHNSVEVIIPESLAGDYNLIFFWRKTGKTTSESYKATPSAVVDNINVLYNSCVVPSVKFTETLNDNATISIVHNIGAEHTAYDIFVTENDSVLVAEDIKPEEKVFERNGFVAEKLRMTGFASSTNHYLFIRSHCGNDNYSDWSRVEFATACDPIAIPHTFGFEEAEGLHDGASKTYKVPDCFMQGPAPVASGAYFPYAVINSNNKIQSRDPSDENQYALHFTHGKNESQVGKYIVFPLMNADLSELRLRFWMRAAYEYNDGRLNSYTSSTYDPTLVIGTMTDPTDPETFRELKTVAYSLTISGKATDDPTGNRYWEEISVPLAGAEGKYIVMKNNMSADKYTYLWIDDLTIEYVADCATPYDVEVSRIAGDEAALTFRHLNGEKWAVAISTRTDMADTLRVDTLTTATDAVLTNLTPNTQYTVSVQQICSESQQSDWSQPVTFETYARPRFFEGFTASRSYPELWMVSTQKASAIFGGEEIKQTTGTARFRRVTSHGLSGAHSVMSLTSSNASWLVTPKISLENATDVQLTFNLALTSQGVSAPINDAYKGAVDKYFMVVVSKDGGATWTEEDILDVWANEGTASAYAPTRVLDNISYSGEKVRIDLSKYAGEVIKVGFYAASGDNTTYYDLHIDNVQVNSFKEESAAISICETYDLETDLISVTSDKLQLGDNVFSVMKVSNNSQPDVNYTLTVKVNEMCRTHIKDSICAGDVYSKYGFNTTRGGRSMIKVPAENSCDSVVYLDLSLIQPKFTSIKDTTCQGQRYVWNGKVLDRTGIYYDTIPTTTSRCDSVVELLLVVTPALVYDVDMSVCFGETYQFGDRLLEETDDYTATFTSSEGCDSIVNLHFVVRPDYRTSIHDVLCEGEKYNKHGFIGVVGEGPHVLPLTTKDGDCDSTITLTLTIIKGDETHVSNTITVEELPYRYLDLYYDENTRPGTYRDTLEVKTETCSSTIYHELIVKLQDNVETVLENSIDFVPNPVKAGSTVTVLADFSAAERQGLTVSVFSATGSLLQQFSPATDLIQINGLTASGMYMVIVTDGLGNVHTGKIIVK